jgi:hypothetical protein
MTCEKVLGSDGEPVNENMRTRSVWPNKCSNVRLEKMAVLLDNGDESDPNRLIPSLGRTDTAAVPEHAAVAGHRTKTVGSSDAFRIYLTEMLTSRTGND